ncbi:snake venom 5'-nucleotidase isoform X2 [Neocloeon triangulifer]|uniref:snake venom 5'-nucleotidase isoform X2 n=1 Tax=Neocloeon triangulifer TaxID=2078957 RepID=UPI00286F0D7A|nr:snake venom 5'-nucleotidase isoform X2 [Neocloeon triangulifer]
MNVRIDFGGPAAVELWNCPAYSLRISASHEVRQAGLRTLRNNFVEVHTMGSNVPLSSITILHFNDVYNVEPADKEPVGGAARFVHVIKSLEHLNPLILFSGDAIAPSMLSTFTKGEQMIPVLNECNVHCAVYGNHEFDFGLDVLLDWVSRTNFPWLMSNVLDNETGRPLADGKITHVVQWGGHKIGLIGLVEREWLDTLASINTDEVTFINYIEAGKKLAQQLKEEGCEYVIALTHMRTPNDVLLIEGVPEIDLFLGGHDHVYDVQLVDGRYLIKSGTDFRQMSKITLTFTGKNVDVDIEEINVTSKYPEDDGLKKELEKYSAVIAEKMEEVLGTFAVPLDGRFASIRTSETNLGNWVCDVILAATGADFVLLNSGTLRSDREHCAGEFTLRDLMSVLPMMDCLTVLSVTGSQILKMLENSVSQYPRLEGRFPQVSGISFGFDPNASAGQRVDPQFVRIGDEYLSLDQRYKLATKKYVAQGKDGYDCLRESKILVDADDCVELRTAIQNHFHAIKMRQGQTKRHTKHRQSLVTISRRHSLVKMLETTENSDAPPPLRRSSIIDQDGGPPPLRNRLTRRASIDDLEQETCELCPKVEGRIVHLTPETRRRLTLERQRIEADSVIPEADESISPRGSFDNS